LAIALSAAEQENEDQRNAFAAFKKERSNEMVLMNTEIANKQKELETKQSGTKKLVSNLDTAILGGSTKTKEVGQVLRAVDNLLERVYTHKARSTGSGGSGGATAAQLVATIKGRATTAAGAPNAPSQEEKKEVGGGGGDKKKSEEASLEEETRLAEDSLAEISEHMVDHAAIVEEWAAYEERKMKEALSRIDED
jgi:hypothetical protein